MDTDTSAAAGTPDRGTPTSRTSGTTATTSSSPCEVTTAMATASPATIASRRSRGGRDEVQADRVEVHPQRGTSTEPSRSSTTSAEVTRRTQSSGRSEIRWASAGTATALTSSGVT